MVRDVRMLPCLELNYTESRNKKRTSWYHDVNHTFTDDNVLVQRLIRMCICEEQECLALCEGADVFSPKDTTKQN